MKMYESMKEAVAAALEEINFPASISLNIYQDIDTKKYAAELNAGNDYNMTVWGEAESKEAALDHILMNFEDEWIVQVETITDSDGEFLYFRKAESN